MLSEALETGDDAAKFVRRLERGNRIEVTQCADSAGYSGCGLIARGSRFSSGRSPAKAASGALWCIDRRLGGAAQHRHDYALPDGCRQPIIPAHNKPMIPTKYS